MAAVERCWENARNAAANILLQNSPLHENSSNDYAAPEVIVPNYNFSPFAKYLGPPTYKKKKNHHVSDSKPPSYKDAVS